ncbi:hypothetical protein BCY86_05505 [Pajaroellobacter abortibovis]|uniref:Uncharacterized protein n=1 Tax=Pajaroellobacter abortibovis TaxID=1882918 RepID=A0A1L6MXJ7_9BACT|nr:hypothetical protein BCY86_05505 [Pajaroellobacter abortibovis]
MLISVCRKIKACDISIKGLPEFGQDALSEMAQKHGVNVKSKDPIESRILKQCLEYIGKLNCNVFEFSGMERNMAIGTQYGFPHSLKKKN